MTNDDANRILDELYETRLEYISKLSAEDIEEARQNDDFVKLTDYFPKNISEYSKRRIISYSEARLDKAYQAMEKTLQTYYIRGCSDAVKAIFALLSYDDKTSKS